MMISFAKFPFFILLAGSALMPLLPVFVSRSSAALLPLLALFLIPPLFVRPSWKNHAPVMFTFLRPFILLLIGAIALIPFQPYGLAGLPTLMASFGVALCGAILWLSGRGLTLIETQKLRWVFCSAVVVAAILLSLQFGFQLDFFYRLGGGIKPIYFNDLFNRSAVIIFLCFMVAFFSAPSRLLQLSLLVLSLLFVFLSESESAKLGFLVFIIAAPLSFYTPRFLAITITAFSFFLLWGLPFVLPSLFDALLASPLGNWKSGTLAARLEIWEAIGRQIPASLLFGHGFDSTRYLTNLSFRGLFWRDSGVLHPHNGFLQIWVDLGLVGAVTASIGLLVLMRCLLQQPLVLQRFGLCFVAVVLAIASVSHGLWQAWWLCGVIFCLALALLFLKQALEQA